MKGFILTISTGVVLASRLEKYSATFICAKKIIFFSYKQTKVTLERRVKNVLVLMFGLNTGNLGEVIGLIIHFVPPFGY